MAIPAMVRVVLDNIVELIKRRRLQILVHSALYYTLNENVIDDHTYDKWSKELAELQRDYPQESKQAPMYDDFAEFDGSTGFDLPHKAPDVVNRARHILRYAKGRR